jgi:hypothetical protein
MPYIGYIPYIAHIVAQVHQVPVQHVEGHRRAGMAEMSLAVDGGTADIHSHKGGARGSNSSFPACEGIV